MAQATSWRTSGTFSSTAVSDWVAPLPESQKNGTLRVELYGTTGGFTGTVELVWGIDVGSTEGSTWQSVMNASYTTTTSEIIEVGSRRIQHALRCTALSAGTVEYLLTD